MKTYRQNLKPFILYMMQLVMLFAAARGRNIVRFVGFQHENICEMDSECKNSHAASKTSDTYIKCQKTLVNT